MADVHNKLTHGCGGGHGRHRWGGRLVPIGRGCHRCGSWLVPLVPVASLVMMPKCPACVVAWVALFTGVGISISTASLLRSTLIVGCTASLVYLAVRWLRQPLTGLFRTFHLQRSTGD